MAETGVFLDSVAAFPLSLYLENEKVLMFKYPFDDTFIKPKVGIFISGTDPDP